MLGNFLQAQSISELMTKAQSGDAKARLTLGEMYLYGSGTKVNVDSALWWFNRASSDLVEAVVALINLGEKTGDENDDKAVYLNWLNQENVSNSSTYHLELQGNQYVYPNQDIRVSVNNSTPEIVKGDESKYFQKDISLAEGVNVVRVYRQGKCVIERPVVYQKDFKQDNENYTLNREIITQEPINPRKVALVIGNSKYQVSPLRNPTNDATDIAQKLKSLDFDVDLQVDLSLQQMENALLRFKDKSQNSDVAMFYYAGHGLQVSGENYLVPIDAMIANESDIKYKCENANYVLDLMQESNVKLKIVILDACRNNPFGRGMGRGLASMNSPSGSFLAFATGPGDVAMDGRNRNSPYTTAILKHIATPNISIYECFQNIGETVSELTRGHQNPWISASLKNMFYFNKNQ